MAKASLGRAQRDGGRPRGEKRRRNKTSPRRAVLTGVGIIVGMPVGTAVGVMVGT